MEFINVAQVTMQFHKRGRDTFLDHRKTQASEKAEPLPISLREDGVNVYHRDAERFAIAADIINNNPSAGMRELDKMIAQRLGISERTARNIRLGIQQTKGSDEAADATSNSG
jgi:hypothetical protein